MRAWRFRQLGWGSNISQDTASSGPWDRFGDFKLEGNIEYRFNLGRLFGVKIQSALFTDFGNIWLLKTDPTNPSLEGATFKFKNLYRDLAVAGGTSLRIDFDFFLIRFDWAYKLKNPFYRTNNGWFQELKLLDGTFQLGIGYPF